MVVNPAEVPEQKTETRIARIQRRYQTGDAFISVERARYYTESWAATAASGLPLGVRVALAMKNVYKKMTIALDPDDGLAGTWTEHFLGVPIDIEKGVFNEVFASELTKPSMIAFRGRSAAKGLLFMARKGALGDFIRNQRISKASGVRPLNMDFKTMGEREINPYQISVDDRRELLGELLPWWKGKTIVDRIEAELARSGLYSEDMHDFVVAIPGNTSRQVFMLSTCATIATIQGHVILDYERVLDVGLDAMAADVKEKLEEATGEERGFLESMRIAMEGVKIFARRLADRIEEAMACEADAGRRAELARMLTDCRTVPFRPAGTFRQAVQSLWTVKTAVELAHPINLHCFGRLDQTLYPYYQKDIDAGVIDRPEAQELLEELLLKIMSQNIRPESNFLGNFYHRYLGSAPVTIGGMRPDGRDGTNELTMLFLDAAHRSKAVTNISLRVGPDTPDALLDKLAECLHQGTSSYSLFNDEVTIEAMRRRGFAEADARDYAIMGCVEATCPGKTGSMSATALLLARLLDITLRNGDSATMAGTMRGEGLETGDPISFRCFDDIVEALLAQGRHFVGKIVEGTNLKDRVYAEHLPAPYISAFMDGCLEKKKDVTRGGAKYDLAGISMINSMANLVDSLLVIKKLVFEQKKFTIAELVDALDVNFAGHEEMLESIRGVPGKWGNGDAETDALAARIAGELFGITHGHRTLRGGPFVVYVISMITHTIDGRLSIASPDGRPAATPYAASCNPYNVEKAGVTATLRSVASLPYEDVMGCAVNVKFHPSAIGETREARAKWASLVRTYFAMGGAQIQPTVVSSEVLREAQKNPEAHRDLIVKVGGYSTYFVDLGREIQEEVIARTEHV